MTWSSAWRAALSEAQIEPIILVDVGTSAWTDVTEATGFSAGGEASIFGSTFSSHPYVPGVTAISSAHYVGDLRTAGQSVKLQEWTTSAGGFSFSLTSTKPGVHALPFVPSRGMFVRIRVGFAGMTSLGFESVAYGMLDNVTHDQDTWWVRCRDFWDVVRTRPSVGDVTTDPEQFFTNSESTTTLSSDWTSGGNPLPVADLSIFEKDARTGAVGVAYVEGAADRKPWWFIWSAKSGSTGAGTLTNSGSVDWFGMAAAGTPDVYPTGTVVRSYGVITGQPWNVAGRILRSNGDEETSGFNTLPKSWGIGLELYLINALDIKGMGDHPAVDGLDPKWTPFILAPVPDMLQVIQQGLGQFNMWPVQYEDQLSIRLAYNYYAYETVLVDTIDDDWITEIQGHDLYHPDCPVEYHRVGGNQDALGALYSLKGHAPRSRPWLEKYEKTIAANGATVTIEGTESSNTPDAMTSWAAGTAEALADSRTLTTRAHTWYTRIPEYLKINTRTLRYAPLVPGDLVSITSRHIIGRDGLYSETTGMVTGVQPDWIQGSVTLEIAVLPRRDTP